MHGVLPQLDGAVLFDALNSMEEALVVYDVDGYLRACNQSFLEMYGYTALEAVPGVHFRKLGEIDIRRGNVVIGDEKGENYLERKAIYRQSLKGSFTVKLQDGRWIRTTDRPMPDGGFVSVHVDVTELKQAQEKMQAAQKVTRQHENELAALNESLERQVAERTRELEDAILIAEQLARTDVLTGIKNRRAFFESALAIHDLANRFNHPYSIIMIDIDYFKEANDSHGHVAGDRVIIELANIIERVIRNTDVAGRIGGDEFAIVLPETSVENILSLAERVRTLFSEVSIAVNDEELHFTVSLGIAEKINSDVMLEDVMLRADAALYQAKQQGRNSVIVFQS